VPLCASLRPERAEGVIGQKELQGSGIVLPWLGCMCVGDGPSHVCRVAFLVVSAGGGGGGAAAAGAEAPLARPAEWKTKEAGTGTRITSACRERREARAVLFCCVAPGRSQYPCPMAMAVDERGSCCCCSKTWFF
jgi:hypothetical protein